jgi:hypothetical protein
VEHGTCGQVVSKVIDDEVILLSLLLLRVYQTLKQDI